LEQLEHAMNPGLTGGGEAVEIEASDRDDVRSERDALDNVGAAAEPAVHDDLSPPADRRHDIPQDVDRAAPVIELPTTMIGNIDAVNAVVAGNDRVLRGLDALDDERQLAPLPEPFDLCPAQRRLIALGGGVGGRPHQCAFADIAFAPAVVRDVDGERKAVVA